MIRQEQCDKVCRILDDVLANRPTERDSLIVATRKAFEALGGTKWIPCSERLPEEKGRYLVYYTLCGTVRDIRTAMFYPGGWLEWDVDGIAGIALVRAWMPLPEPYEEGK